MDFAWAKSPADHMDQYVDLVGSSQGKGVPSSMMAQMKRHASYVAQKLTPEQHAKLHKNISAHANRLVKDDEISAEEAAYIKKTYSPPVKESTDMDIQEKKMTEPEMKKREKMVKSMKKNFGDFKKRYGERAKEVMYATATKQAMKSEEVEQTEQIEEGSDTPDTLPVQKMTSSFGLKRRNPAEVATQGPRKGLITRKHATSLKQRILSAKNLGVNHGPMGKLPEETEDLEGQHYCAKHVYSDVFGEGVVVEGQHADPDENGNIEWYTVQFEHGEEVIFTEDVEVMMAEYHNNHSPMKKKAKKAKE